MSTDHPQGSPERKEVSRSARAHRPKQRSHIGNTSIRNALLLAGGLTLGGSIPPGIQGCAPESESDENIGHTSEALTASVAWNPPTTPSFGSVPGDLNEKPFVTRSGSNIRVIWGQSKNGVPNSAEIMVVGSNDSGATWTAPAPTAVGYSGIGTAISEAGKNDVTPVICYDATYCGSGSKMFMTKVGKMQVCDWDDVLNQGGNCRSVGTNINTIGAGATPMQVKNGYLYYTAANLGQSDVYRTPLDGSISTPTPLMAAGTLIPSLNTGMNEDGLWIDGTYGIVATEGRGGDGMGSGSVELHVFDWNEGAVTASGFANFNNIGGGSSTSTNTVGDEVSPMIDSEGDEWHAQDSQIKWGTKKSVMPPDGGTGGDGGGGEGGTDAGPCFAQITQNPGNVTIQNCTDTQLNAQINGPATVKIGNKTFKVTDGTGTMDFSQPNYVNLSEGIEYEDEEPLSEANKIISNEHGVTLGFEGTKTRRTYPAALNPNKASKVFNIVAYTTVDGTQRAYDQACVPESNSVSHCNPVDFTAPGSADRGAIPAGVTMFRELSTGQLADDPNKFNIIPPVEEPPEGCTCASVQHTTANGVDIILLAAGVAGILRRKRKTG